jgi:hypothetical protein
MTVLEGSGNVPKLMMRTLALSTLVMVCALSASPPVLAQMMKEGTTNGTYYAYGTFKGTPVGKERLLITFEDNGLSVGQGITDHMTWHCWGTGDFINGIGKNHGYCLGIDTARDQVALDWSDTEKHTLDAKEVAGSYTYTTGTGKFAGITGTGTTVDRGNAFKPLTEGSYLVESSYQVGYKLPAPSN